MPKNSVIHIQDHILGRRQSNGYEEVFVVAELLRVNVVHSCFSALASKKERLLRSSSDPKHTCPRKIRKAETQVPVASMKRTCLACCRWLRVKVVQGW